MRSALIALGLVLLLGTVDHTQSDRLQGGILFAPNSARTVTISRDGELLASLSFPEDRFLAVSYDDRQPNSITSGRWEFHGDFVLRVRTAKDVSGRSSGEPVFQITNGAPVTLTAQGVDVVIANVP